MAAFGAAALLAVNVLAVGVTAGHIAPRLFPDPAERLERLLLGLLCALVEIVAVLTVLGLAHGIDVASVTTAHLALGTVMVAVAIAGLQPSDRPTLVDVARRMIGRPGRSGRRRQRVRHTPAVRPPPRRASERGGLRPGRPADATVVAPRRHPARC
jgi:hypothetical protein